MVKQLSHHHQVNYALVSRASPTMRGMCTPPIQPLPTPEHDSVAGLMPTHKQKFFIRGNS